MRLEWARFAQAIEQNIETPVPGEYGRHIQEILLAAEESAMTHTETVLPSGLNWSYQATGDPIHVDHGWV